MSEDVRLTEELEPANLFGTAADGIFRSIFDLYGVLDRNGSVISLDGRIFERTGTNPKLLTGQTFAQTVFWQSSETTASMLEQAIHDCASGTVQRTTLDFRVNADEKIPFELDLVPCAVAGEPDSIFISGHSVEQLSKRFSRYLGESEQLLLAAENADIGLWYWDFDEDRIYSTPRCNELFETPEYEELKLDRVMAIVHPGDQEIVKKFLETARVSGKRYSAEFRVLYGDGRLEWIAAEGKSVDVGKMMGVVRKITEQKLAAEELKRVNDLVKKTRDEAVEANRAKDFFLAFVSHEIRSSLNAIIGWSRILLTKDVDEPTSRNALETIERSARTQAKLINDLVDSARVASGKLRLEYRPMDICEVVRGTFETHRPAAESQKIDYRFECDVEKLITVGDSARLQQVFGNLISNALKFTPAGGEIVVSLKTGAEAVTINVHDTGRGISPDNLPKIFRQFSQADSGAGNSGLGLGLSIVKILTERHGGHVRAESKGLGKGSLFSVTLPITSEQQSAKTDVEPIKDEVTQKPLAGVSILIVEDNVDSREVLQMFLEKSGADVAAAESARIAFTMITDRAKKLPDVMISDLAMPEEDGYSLVSRIRDLPKEKGGEIPAIALSAFANDESRRKAHESGFNRYATKPFDHDLLIGDILDMLKLYGGKNGS